MRLLMLGALRAHTGNGTTARRIQDHIEAAGHSCALMDISSCKSPLAVSNLISSENFEAALGIHLYKAGRLLQASCQEQNICSSSRDSPGQQQPAPLPLDMRPEKSQGSSLSSECFCRTLSCCLIEWHREEPSTHLIIIGPAVDPLFAEEVKEKIKRADGVHLLQEISQEDLHALVKKCFAVVNSSISEGMSATILEAMDLNVPVMARNIPGNAAIIAHKTTGLLYSNPQEFVQLSKSLIGDPFLHKEIVMKAKEYVTKHHSWEHERKAYQNLVLMLQ
ncbi:glycosyltransferase 1 domain-containing protein 1 isoform X7 [Podarcis raffonei]|uniref:glycosyltransferase 1 domain-containing protein 1 isoform X7 n=1 Tax=Podarcis raffonei TaxID=65483 RepID=UPI0023291B7F|nr:glycosyltransferase 1 domain-containing protein 1 isoform X7 [Podarcis raffonei]